MVAGPVAAILAMRAPHDRHSKSDPPLPLRRTRKISHTFGKFSGNKPASRSDALLPQLVATQVQSSPSCHLNAVLAPSVICTDVVPGAPPMGSTLATTSVITCLWNVRPYCLLS